MKWGINDTHHYTITDVWFLTYYRTTLIDNNTAAYINIDNALNLWKEKVNYEARETTLGYGLTDVGAIQVIKLNPYFKIQKKVS